MDWLAYGGLVFTIVLNAASLAFTAGTVLTRLGVSEKAIDKLERDLRELVDLRREITETKTTVKAMVEAISDLKKIMEDLRNDHSR